MSFSQIKHTITKWMQWSIFMLCGCVYKYFLFYSKDLEWLTLKEQNEYYWVTWTTWTLYGWLFFVCFFVFCTISYYNHFCLASVSGHLKRKKIPHCAWIIQMCCCPYLTEPECHWLESGENHCCWVHTTVSSIFPKCNCNCLF